MFKLPTPPTEHEAKANKVSSKYSLPEYFPEYTSQFFFCAMQLEVSCTSLEK